MPTDNEKLIFDKYVRAKDAKFISATYSSLAQSRELVIGWPGQNDFLNEQILRALDKYSSSLNFPNERLYVVNPLGDDEKFSGTWRIVTNRMGSKAEGGGIVQVLREGWATALTESEARIGRYFVDTQNGTYGFSRYWPNIAITSLKALVTGLTGTKTVTNPLARGVVHAGTFALGQPTGEPQEDGAGVIQQTLRLVSTPTTIVRLEATPAATVTLDDVTPLVQIGSQIIDPTVIDPLIAAGPPATDTGLVDCARVATLTFRDLNPTAAVRLLCEETAKPSEFQTAFAASASTILTSGWKYASRAWSDDAETNTGSLIVTFTRNTNTNVTPLVERISNNSAIRTWYTVDSATKDVLTRDYSASPAVALGIARASFSFDHDGDGAASTFVHSDLSIVDNHDRTFTVQQNGRLTLAVADLAALVAMTPVVKNGSEIIDPYAEAGAPLASIATRDGKVKLVFPNLAYSTAIRTLLMDTNTDANYQSEFVGSGKILAAGWNYESRDFDAETDVDVAEFTLTFSWKDNDNIKPHYTSLSPNRLARRWYRVDKATHDTLITGDAIGTFVYGTVDTLTGVTPGTVDAHWAHERLDIVDHHDRTFTLTQECSLDMVATEGELDPGEEINPTVNIYTSASIATAHRSERVYNGIDQMKDDILTQQIRHVTSEAVALFVLQGVSGTILAGSIHISTINERKVKVEWITVAYGDWT